MPIINETGIEYHIDIEFNALKSDFEEIKRELQEQGIKVVKAEKPFKITVITDKREGGEEVGSF